MLMPWVQTPAAEVAEQLRELGFEAGWGSRLGRIRETMNLLLDILQAPGATLFEVSDCVWMPHPPPP